MMFSIVLIFITLFFIAFIVMHFQIFDFKSRFVTAIINVLLLVGVNASIITSFKSIFLVPILGIIIIGLYLRKNTLNFNFSHWKSTLVISSFVSLIFLVLFFRKDELLIPSEDYLFWIRVGLFNQRFGVENINVFYNLIDSSYTGADLYHHFEFWLMNLGSILNRQNASLNLFFFSYPLGIIICCEGIKELIISFYPEFSNKFVLIHISIFFLIVGFLFFMQPWDTFNYYLGINNLPISGMGFIWRGLKMIYVLNIVIALFLYLKTTNFDTFITVLLVSFFYIPVFPIVILTVFIWMFYMHFYVFRTTYSNFFILIYFSLGTVLFYLFFGNHGGTTVSNFSLVEWLNIDVWVKYMPAILMKVLLIPIFGFFPFFLLILKRRKYILSLKPALFITILYIICISVWCLFVNNVDANQAFLLLFGGIIPAVILFSTWNLIFIKKKLVMGFFLIALYLLPGVIDAMNFNSPIKRDSASTIQFINQLNSKRLLYLPEKAELNSIYDFNERVYTGVNQFILYNTSIDLISVSASFKGNNIGMNASTSRMYNFYKQNSPYYKECGYVEFSSQCFVNFLKKSKIDIICTRNKDLNIKGWSKSFENLDYSFYELN